jgi:diguanylate cyclase (GGDEF)-like protein
MPEQVAQALRLVSPGKTRKARPVFPDHPLLFILLDLDHFKRVNDEHGHEAGDAVLRSLGTLLQDLMRESDTISRWGGEEFLIVARQVGLGDPATLAERIRKAVEKNPVTLESGTVLNISVSIGFCPFPLGYEATELTWEKAIMLADRALYAAKRSGRNGWIGLGEGPAFCPIALMDAAGHPDIPDLIARGILHIEHSFEEMGKDAWI